MKQEPFEPKGEPISPKIEPGSFQVKDEPFIKQEASRIVKNEAQEAESDSESVSSSVSSTDERTRCPICLTSYKNQNSANPDVCEHRFCLECIEEWSKKTNTCPIDRKTYRFIIASIYEPGSKVPKTKRIAVENRSQQTQYDTADLTYCEVCRRSDREDRMLLCDGCDNGYHCECLQPAIDHIPEGQWFCAQCQSARTSNTGTRLRRVRPNGSRTERLNNITAQAERLLSELHSNEENEIDVNEINELMINVMPSTSRTRTRTRTRQTITFIRPIARTRFMERVRHSVNENRIQRGGYIIETEDEETDEHADSYDSEEGDSEEGDSEEVEEGGHEACCSCIMCDESCKVDMSQSAATTKKPRRKKTTKRRRRKPTKRLKRGSKTKRRRKTYKRASTAPVSTQSKILQRIQSAQQQQFSNERSMSQCPLTLTSIELELMRQPDKMTRKPARFPAENRSTWHANSILSEVDETNRDIPLSSMSLLDTEPRLFNQSQQKRTSQSKQSKQTTASKPATTDFLSSILNSQKVLLAPSNKIKVQRDGSLHLNETTKSNKPKQLIHNSNSLPGTSSSLVTQKKMIDTSTTIKQESPAASAKPEDENNAYDPFNPDDSPEETPKQIKFGIKSSLKQEKTTKLTPLCDSPLNPITNEIKPEKTQIKSEPVAKDSTKSSNSRIKTEPTDQKKRHRSKSPQIKKKSKTRSKSRSPRRRSDEKTPRSHRQRSRSNSNRRSRDRGGRDRSERDKKSREPHRSKRSKSKSPGKISYSSNNSKYAPPKPRDYSDHRRDHSHRQERHERHKTSNTDLYNKAESLKSSNKEQKYSDYLIEEMINEEKQQVIDINNISLPADNKPKQTSSLKQNGEASKTYLDKRLDLIFGDNAEKGDKESKGEQIKKESESIDNQKKVKESVSKPVKVQVSNGNHKPVDKKAQSNSILDTQEKIVDAAKTALKPHFISNKVSKEDYKTIMRKVVTKALHFKKTGGLVDRHRVTKMVSEQLKATHQSDTKV